MGGRTAEEHLVVVLRAPFKLAQYLIVSLPSHDYLTVDVLNVHIFATVSSIGPHKACLVCDADVIDCRCRGRMLE